MSKFLACWFDFFVCEKLFLWQIEYLHYFGRLLDPLHRTFTSTCATTFHHLLFLPFSSTFYIITICHIRWLLHTKKATNLKSKVFCSLKKSGTWVWFGGKRFVGEKTYCWFIGSTHNKILQNYCPVYFIHNTYWSNFL